MSTNMKYRLSWLETWSTKHGTDQPDVTVEYGDSEGWFDHEYTYKFTADNDRQAKVKALKFIEKRSFYTFEIWSVYNDKDEPILTEEYV